MNTMSRIVSAVAAAGTLLLSAPGVFAQPNQPAEGIPPGSTQTCLFRLTPVLNAPFSAEATITWQPPAGKGTEQRAVARYYRNREGRVRVEQGFAGSGRSPRRIILAPDDSRNVYLIDPATGALSIWPRPLADHMVGVGCHDKFVLPDADGGFVSFFQHVANQELLGERFVSGVQTTGTRFTTFDDGQTERWVSPELKLVVYLRSEETRMGTFKYQLTGVSRAEPRAELFVAPADSEVITGKSPRTLFPGPWRSAYTEMAKTTQ